ncbi:AAEL010445-PA, partial [Aedes aegypti]
MFVGVCGPLKATGDSQQTRARRRVERKIKRSKNLAQSPSAGRGVKRVSQVPRQSTSQL